MARITYIQDPVTLELVPKDEYYANRAEINAPMVMADIKPYRSMIDGRMIESRSTHREHLRANGCIEVGNETKHIRTPQPMKAPPGLKQRLIEVANSKL